MDTLKSKITIEQESSELTKYTHCAGRDSAEALIKSIEELEAAGFEVVEANASRPSVPVSYRSAYKMHSPSYSFVADSRRIVLFDDMLQNRSQGRFIPANFEIAGGVVPKGFRCFSRSDNTLTIRYV